MSNGRAKADAGSGGVRQWAAFPWGEGCAMEWGSQGRGPKSETIINGHGPEVLQPRNTRKALSSKRKAVWAGRKAEKGLQDHGPRDYGPRDQSVISDQLTVISDQGRGEMVKR
jgi:hypothetical protein